MARSSLRAGGWAVGVLAAVLTGAGCEVRAGSDGDLSFGVWQGSAQDTWDRTYPVAPGGRVEILNVNGEIRAEAVADGPVVIHAERRVNASSDEAARDQLARLEMREEVSPTRVRVETVAPRSRWGGHKVTYTVRVPAGVHVDLRTVNGGVRLDNVGGEVRATATNGGVHGRVADVTLLDARTTNGGVEVEVSGSLAADGRVSLASVNGGVRLAVPDGTRADITARCTNGRVSVSDLDVAVDGEVNRRRLSGRLNGGGARIDLQTTNGGVAIRRS
ncbi:MAG: DUF4097 family beta strand repeat-containing protein [Vicinamibacterales bacterium]